MADVGDIVAILIFRTLCHACQSRGVSEVAVRTVLDTQVGRLVCEEGERTEKHALLVHSIPIELRHIRTRFHALSGEIVRKERSIALGQALLCVDICEGGRFDGAELHAFVQDRICESAVGTVSCSNANKTILACVHVISQSGTVSDASP